MRLYYLLKAIPVCRLHFLLLSILQSKEESLSWLLVCLQMEATLLDHHGYAPHISLYSCYLECWKLLPCQVLQTIDACCPKDYAKFSFEEMKDIYHYIGMDYWHLLTETLCTEHKVELTDTSCLIFLVSVCAFNCLTSRQWCRDKADKAGMALKEIRKLYGKSF